MTTVRSSRPRGLDPAAPPPRVSVVVPCYRYGAYLEACVGSVLEQEGVEVDVVIVDDASPDGSAAVARRLAEADRRVRLIEHLTNRGHIATYNEGLAAAEGTYVVLVSADDLLTPGSLARSTALLEAHPEVGFVYGHAPSFTAAPPRPRSKVRSWSVWTGEAWLAEVCCSVTNPTQAPTAVMRTSILRMIGGYDARLPHSADLHMWLRAAARAGVGRINGADQAAYRLHGENMHVQHFGTAFADIVQRHLAFRALFDEDRELLERADELERAAVRALAREALAIARDCTKLARYRHEEPEHLLAFAREVAPPATHHALWRAARRPRRSRWGGLDERLDVLVDDLHGRLRWRRWRRTGMYSPVRSR